MQPPTRQVAAELFALRPSLPRRARVLFVGDPFPQNEYFLYFLTRLLYRDLTLTVDKAPNAEAHYDTVFVFRDGHFLATNEHK